MGGTTLTHLSLLVVIFQVDLDRVLTLPFKSDAPRAVDLHAKTLWLALQPMEIKTRDIQSVRCLSGINRIKAAKCPFSQGLLQLCAGTLLKKGLKPFVPKRLDHDEKCNAILYTFQAEGSGLCWEKTRHFGT